MDSLFNKLKNVGKDKKKVTKNDEFDERVFKFLSLYIFLKPFEIDLANLWKYNME